MKNIRIFLLFSMLCAILFIPHINRNIDTGDGGEFILTASLLGNAHPSGYPLYNISAHLFHLLPFGNEAFKASLFSMTFLIACGFFVALIIEELSDDFVFAFTGGIACICGFTFLYSGLTQEAYTLMLFFLLGALYFYIRYLNTLNFDYAKACFFSVGLMTAVHITGVFYFIILFICILANRDGEDRIRKIITSFYFALPLVIYGFMFFRGDAVFSWGRVENIGDVYALISGSERDVGSRFFSLEPAQYLQQFSVYISHVVKEHYFMILFLFPGLYSLYRFEKRYFYPLFLFSGWNVLFFISVGRDLSDKSHFFLISHAMNFIFMWWGGIFIYSYFMKKKRPYFLVLIPLVLLMVNVPDFSGLNVLSSHTSNIFLSVPEDRDERSAVITSGDAEYFSAEVVSTLYGVRPDIDILSRDLMNSEWYRKIHGNMDEVIRKYNGNVYFTTLPFEDWTPYYVMPVGILYTLRDEFGEYDLRSLKNLMPLEYRQTRTLSVFRAGRVDDELAGIVSREAGVYNDIGIQLMKESRHEKAKDIFEYALRFSGDPGIFSNLQKADENKPFYDDNIEELIDKRQLGRAIQKLEKTGQYERLSDLLADMGEYDRVIRLPEKSERALGLVAFSRGRYEDAADLLKDAGDRKAIFCRALALYRTGKVEQALDIMYYIAETYQDRRAVSFIRKVKGYYSID